MIYNLYNFVILVSVSGNANFRMTQTSFTILGFTRPQEAMPIITNVQNNATGFASNILWLFPEPVFCRFKDSTLTPHESEEAMEFEERLGMYITIMNVLLTWPLTTTHLKWSDYYNTAALKKKHVFLNIYLSQWTLCSFQSHGPKSAIGEHATFRTIIIMKIKHGWQKSPCFGCHSGCLNKLFSELVHAFI